MTPTPLYRLREVRKSYKASFRLEIDALDIHTGEVLALLGPTGAGKSTLLRLLAGVEIASSGRVEVGEPPLDAAKLPLHWRRRIAMVHQRPLLLNRDVRANVEYGLSLRGIPSSRKKADVDQLLDRFGLTKFASQAARTLSGGQTQLVALARALIVEPDILLLDEPTANLDPAHVEIVETTLRSIQAERQVTVVWATHNLFQARRVANRVALLWNGQLIEASESNSFFETPADPRTADFLQGRMIY